MVAKYSKIKKSSSWKGIFFPVFLGLLILVVIGFLVVSNWKMNQRRAELNSRIEALKTEIQILEERKKELETGISYQKSEEYLEEVAREKLNLQQPGEQVVAFTKEEEKEGGIEKERGFLDRILEKLKFW